MPDESFRLVHASGECEIDFDRRELRVLGSPVPVGGRAFEVIEVLARSAGELVTKDELMNRIWPGAIVMDSTLHVHASAVRKALGPYRSLLKTESGRGYRLIGDWTVRRQEAAAPLTGLQRMRVDGASPVTNFPAAVTRLVGRTAAVARLRDLISAYRVVTLTGPGGIGKTSLALQVARGIADDFSDGGWWVELAALSDSTLVASAVAQVLGIKAGGEAITPGIIARAVGTREILLVLDNCEHVIDAVADLAEILVRQCARIAILTTSHEALRVNGEAVFRLPPLDVPEPGQQRAEDILSHSAVELFIARANALGFSSTTESLPEIAGICRDLDGIPLAIEFAAARVATLGVNTVATGLRDRFALLTSGRRGAPARHRTLRATLDWSYGFLSEPERKLLRRLAVFTGGFALEAATSVMRDSGLDQAALVDGISNLVAKSLVTLGAPATDRWRLLETIRAYALEKLVEHGEADAAARHHATYFRDLVTSLAPGTRLSLPADEFTRCLREIDNVRAALDWSFSPGGDAAVGLDLTAAYVPVWSQATLVVECRERTERALSRLDSESGLDERARLRLHMGFGLAAVFTVQPVERARTILGTAVDIAEHLEDLDTQLWATWGLWMAHFYSGECHAAFSLAERLAVVASRIGEPFALITADRHIGNTLHHLGDQPRAQIYLERAIERSATPAARQNSMYPQVDQRVFARAYLARVLLLRGYPDQAVEQARSSLDEAVATGFEPLICQALRLAICPIALMTGDLTAAKRDIARLADIADAFSAPFWKAAARSFEGKLMIARGEFEVGTTLVRAELDASARTGWTNWYPEFLGVYAEGLSGLGRYSEAVAAIDQALARADQSGEQYHVAELLRLKGEFLLAQSDGAPTAAIDDCFHAALTIARQQGAQLFELRAALSLARWRLRQERHAEAKQNLSAVYDRFTEGFGTADLYAAKAFLDELPT